jgi:hypothetical protein
MRRVLALLATTALLLAAGCGGRSYEARLNKTLDDMRYVKRLDDNLSPAPTKGKLEASNIYIRPPKTLTGPAKEFQLTVLEPGKFDISDSFFESGKANLHVLGRIKVPKAATPKKAAPTPAEAATRGDFTSDVLALLGSVYNVELDPAKAKEEKGIGPWENKFKRLAFEGNGKDVQVFFYGSKATPYEVALIFEYPNTEKASLSNKIELTLGSFATGERARRLFSGSGIEDETAEGAATGGSAAF